MNTICIRRFGSLFHHRVLLLILCLGFARPSPAQLGYLYTADHITSQHNFIDAKQYSIEMTTGANDEQVLAGTLYHDPYGRTSVHFLRIDNNGFPPLADKMYDQDPNATELYYYRAVDIATGSYIGSPRHYITCQGLFEPSASTVMIATSPGPPGYAGQPYKDRIRLMIVDDNGDTVDDNSDNRADVIDIEDFTPVTGYQYNGDHLYPLSSLNSHGRLYICGYLNKNYSNSSNTVYGPQTIDPKEAFVLSVDIDPTSNTYLQVVAAEAFNWDNTTPPPAPPIQFERDYDIAMRMRIIQDPANLSSYKGKLLVTGSVNAQTSTPPIQPYYRSGTMNIALDPANLSLLTDQSFIESPYDADFEYGIDFYEDPNNTSTPSNNSFYIIGNSFVDRSGGAYSRMGLTPDIEGYSVYEQKLTPSNLQPIGNRVQYDGMWALAVMPPAANNNIPGECRIAIAGMTDNNYLGYWTHGSMVGGPQAGDTNLLSVMFDINGTPTLGIATSRTMYLNSHGTGDPATVDDSYYALGWGLSNIAWNPVSASRDISGSNKVYMTAPRMSVQTGKLGFRWMQLNAPIGVGYYDLSNGSPSSCLDWDFIDDILSYSPEVYSVGISCTTRSLTVDTLMPGIVDTALTSYTEACDQAFNYGYKPTSIKPETAIWHISVYPNPAFDNLKVIGLQQQASYNITDVTGREILSGNIHPEHAIDIQYLAQGTYMIHIKENNNTKWMKFVKE